MQQNRIRLAAAVLALALAPGAGAQPPETPPGMIRVVPGNSTRVFVMAAFDAKCQSLAAPPIEIVQAPAKGSVSFREGQTTTVQTSLSGSCVGSRVSGTGIYYTAGADKGGEDRFTISARLATGEVATRSFQMFIAE